MVGWSPLPRSPGRRLLDARRSENAGRDAHLPPGGVGDALALTERLRDGDEGHLEFVKCRHLLLGREFGLEVDALLIQVQHSSALLLTRSNPALDGLELLAHTCERALAPGLGLLLEKLEVERNGSRFLAALLELLLMGVAQRRALLARVFRCHDRHLSLTVRAFLANSRDSGDLGPQIHQVSSY